MASNQLNWSKHKDKLGDPLKTFSEAIDTAVSAAFAKTINTDADENNAMGGSLAFTSSEKTIAESVGVGSITPTRSHHTVDTEADASADDLDLINVTSISDGAILILRAENAGRVVTIKHEAVSGNIHIATDTDYVLDTIEKFIILQRRGTDLYEIARDFEAATQAEQETGTAVDKIVTPGRQHFHRSAAKFTLDFSYGAGVPGIDDSYNVASLDDDGTGLVGINYTTAFSGTAHTVVSNAFIAAGTIVQSNVSVQNAADSQLQMAVGASAATGDIDGRAVGFGDL